MNIVTYQPTHFVGKSKTQVLSHLHCTKLNYHQFAHWLFVPAWGVVLSFDKQVCCQMGRYLW